MIRSKWMPAVSLAACAIVSGLVSSSAHAATILKANNVTALNATGSWVGGVIPGASDVATWDSTVNVARTAPLGGSLSWLGIKITNPGGTQAINATTGAVLTLGSGGIDMSGATADFTLSPALNISTAQTWSVASGRTLTLSSVTGSGSGALTLTGPGTVSVPNGTTPFGTGSLTLTGGVTFSAASLTFANAAILAGDVTLSETNTVGTLTLNGGLDFGSGTGTRTLKIQSAAGTTSANTLIFGNTATATTGSGTLALVNGNTDGVGRTVLVRFDNAVSAGAISVGSNVNLAFGSNDRLSTSAPIPVTVDGRMYLSSGGGTATNQTVASLAGGGNVRNTAAGPAVLTIDGGTKVTSSEFTGVIENGLTSTNAAAAAVGLTKTGTTTQILSGANTYSGATAVNGGTLLINGTNTQSVAGSGYTVASGATLGGTGLIARTSTTANAVVVAVASGGVVAPGGVGTIESLALDGRTNTGTGNKELTMASGSRFAFDLAGNGTAADTLDLYGFNTGEATLASNPVDFQLVGPAVSGTYSVDLFRFYSDGGTSLTTSGLTSGLTLGTLGTGITAANFVYDSPGGLIRLNYTVATPEPAMIAIGSLAGLIVLRRQRRTVAAV